MNKDTGRKEYMRNTRIQRYRRNNDTGGTMTQDDKDTGGTVILADGGGVPGLEVLLWYGSGFKLDHYSSVFRI